MSTAGLGARLQTTVDVLIISARMRISELLATPGTLLITVIQPAALMLIVLLSSGEGSAAASTAMVTGVLLTSFWGATVRGTGAVLARDRAQGVLGRSVTGTKDPRMIVIGKGLGAGLLSLGQIALTLAIVLIALRPSLTAANPLWIAVGLVVALVSGATVGLLIACLFVLTRYALHISTILIYGVYVLGGMLIPPDALPVALRWISTLVSLHWLQRFIAHAADNRLEFGSLGAALVLTAVYAIGGALMFRRVVTRARVEATLDLA